MIKAIFFDAAGILYTRTGHTEDFALKLLQEMGFDTALSPDQKEVQLAIHSKANQGIITHETYWDQFLLMRNVIEPDQRKNIINQITIYTNDVLQVTGAAQTLMKLKNRGLILGIITDTIYPLEWKIRRLEKAGVSEFIDIISCSSELGAHKPDPAVYNYALQQANIKPEEAAFVGHMGIELSGAHQVGMITIAIDHDDGAIADFYCNSLLDLPNLLVFQKNHLEM
jgi:FMN phosphatase YigB (HAD superfamily)